MGLAVRFEGDVAASISGDFASPRRADRFVITGEKGVIDSNHLDGHSFSLQIGKKIEQFNIDRLVALHTNQMLDTALNRD